MEKNQRIEYEITIENYIKTLGSQEFAELSEVILHHIEKTPINRRGQTLNGEPLGHIIDANSDNFQIVAEFSCENTYFTDKNFSKVNKDISHCQDVAGKSKKLYLFSNKSATPKQFTDIQKHLSTKSTEIAKEIFIYDALGISKYIIREILSKQDEEFLDKLKIIISKLKQIQNEFIYTNSLPKDNENYIQRNSEENAIIELLNTRKVVQIYGISGIGKTYIATNVAHQLKQENWTTIFIKGNEIKSAEDLFALKIERYGIPQNLIGLMSRFKTILVVDELESNLDNIVRIIEENIKIDYKLIVTSQSSNNSAFSYLLSPMNEDLSKDLLNYKLTNICPDEIFELILERFQGIPFILSQINVLIRIGKLTWTEIKAELTHLYNSTSDSNDLPYFQKLFQKHLNSISSELEVIKWLDSKEIEYSLLQKLIGVTGIKKLKDRNFLNTYRTSRIVLHDLIHKSLSKLHIEEANKSKISDLEEFLINTYNENDLNFFRVIHTHYDLIKKLALNVKVNNIITYSYLQASSLTQYEQNQLQEITDNQISDILQAYNRSNYFQFATWIERLEIHYRLIKEKGLYNELNSYIDKSLISLELALNAIKGKDDEIYLSIKNHKGKFLRNRGMKAEAISVFKEIIQQDDYFWAAKLHLAKLLNNKDNKADSEKYFLEILKNHKEYDNIPSTIVLAAYYEIRTFKNIQDDVFKEFLMTFVVLIEKSMVTNFDLPYKTLGALAPILSFNYPQELLDLFEKISIPSNKSFENTSLFDIAQIYINVAKVYKNQNNDDLYEKYYNKAISYYDDILNSSSFEKRQMAESYLINKNIKKAQELLELVPDKDREKWWNYSYAKLLGEKGENREALIYINHCIKDDNKNSTFYRQRGIINKHLNDLINSKSDYETAIKNEVNQKYIEQLKNELKLI